MKLKKEKEITNLKLRIEELEDLVKVLTKISLRLGQTEREEIPACLSDILTVAELISHRIEEVENLCSSLLRRRFNHEGDNS